MLKLFRKTIIYLCIKRRSLTVPVWPWKVKINTGYKCVLKCPLCPTGLGHSPNKGDMTPKMFSFLLGKLRPVKEIYLFGWGEPLLNKDIFEIIRLAKAENKYIAMDTCLNVPVDAVLENIVKSGLDLLSVSLDGVSQEDYSKYRMGGDYKSVIGNIKKLQDIKKRMGSKRPRIEWQYCVNKYNQTHIAKAKDMARDLGVKIKFIPIGLYLDCLNEPDKVAAEKWLPFETPWILKGQNSIETPINDSGYCYLLYYFPFIDTDGSVYFCCPAAAAGPGNSLVDQNTITCAGTLKDSGFMEIFNNEIYRHARSLYAAKTADLGKKMVCDVCRMYRKV
jgi:MoaA/NifB/PqqE/SkfB family radical SAM enzyme